MNAHHTETGRIDREHYETSPSCGTFEIAEIYDCPNAHAAEADTSDVDRLAALTREGRPLSYRTKHILEVSS
jgi:hypothetical protein